jgi:hypothetical protein
VLAGCGGGGGNTTATSPPPATSAPPQTTQTATIPERTTPTETETTPRTTTSPEEQPGGAGDEKPIATQALFTGNNGTISPARIRVPPFIAVQVVLRAKDATGYTLTVAGQELAVGEGRKRATVKLDGLRPGDRYVVKNAFGKPKQLVIVANAEPGP